MGRRLLFKHQGNPGRLSIVILILALALGTGVVWGTGMEIAAGGYKYFRNYSKKDYDHHPQNWCITRDADGIVYVGNRAGVLEYDGVSWRLVNVPNLLARVLTIDASGTIYVGGKNELGFLSPDLTGNLQYKSLLDRLEDKNRDFESILQAFAAPDGVYFRTSNYLFRWASKTFKTWTSSSEFNAAFFINGKLYVQQKNTGLQVLEKETFHDIPGGSDFADEKDGRDARKINMMVPFDSRSHTLLIGTRAAGLYLYDGVQVSSFPTEIDALLTKERLLLHGIHLASGEFALATDGAGVIIIDSYGKIKHHFDKSTGLQDHNVKYLYQEPGGNLWLALNNGISRIEYESPFTIYDDRSQLPGTVLSMAKHEGPGTYYIGTNEGLYYSLPGGTFKGVEGISRNCWSLVYCGDSLIAATDDGVYAIKNNNPILIDRDRAVCLIVSREDPHRVWAGASNALISYVEDNVSGRWEASIIDLDFPAQSMVEEPNGTLWLGSKTKGVISISSPGSPGRVIKKYSSHHGLPMEKDKTLGEINVVRIADQTVFATQHGLYRFDKTTGRFVPHPILGKDPAGEIDFDDGTHPLFRIAEDPKGNIWFHSQSVNYEAVRQPNGTYRIDNKFLPRLPISQVNFIYPETGAVWFCTYDSLIRYDTGYRFKETGIFPVFLRRVERIDDKMTLLGRHRPKPGERTISQLPAYPYDYRNLRFSFAAPFYREESRTLYSYFLEGYDRDWSQWSSETRKDYTNLDPGNYTFLARAKNVYGQTALLADGFSFKILPPWYRTTLAYIIYFIIFVFALFGLARFRYRRLEHEKRRLEALVEQRTYEIKEKNLQLEDQTRLLTLQSEQLKEMDKVKSRFFANISHEFRTPLTLIMGPLEQILSGTSGTSVTPGTPGMSDLQLKNKAQLMLRNSQRLLGLINQLLDLSRINSGKMRLQVTRKNIIPFLRGIMASFKLLSEQRQIAFSFQPRQEDITLYFNNENIEQIMNNLLSNAFKNTPPGGSITVSAGVIVLPGKAETFPEGFLEVSVADTGVGISADQLPHMFELFYQPESSYEHKAKGSGIGLALTRELVELHHGDIRVHSTEGQGAEFVFRLPLGKSHLKPEEIIDVTQQPQEAAPPPQEGPSGHLVSRLIAAPHSPGSTDGETVSQAPMEPIVEPYLPPPASLNGEALPLILVVEDNVDMRRYLCSAFEPGYRVIEAEDGKDGWAKASDSIPDLVISDVVMPHMDGFEMCRRIKKDPGTSHIPLILLTARTSPESVLEGLQTGAEDYIPKPFNLDILRARVKNLIGLRRQWQERVKNRMALQPQEIPVSPLDEEFYKELQEAIEKHLADTEFSVERLAAVLYMGRTTLYRKILALTGETPNQFIRSYRLHRAAQLLKARAGNVSEVSSMVGFTNPVYFAHCFKEKYYISPSDFAARRSATAPSNGAFIGAPGPAARGANEELSTPGSPDSSHHSSFIIQHSPAHPLVAEVNNADQPEVSDQELILLVEDSPDLCDYIRDILELHYRVEIVNDGRQGLERAQNLIPDLVISDVLMPGMDGFEMSRRLKSEIATSHIPIILLTARASEKDILKGFETGVEDYITKPFNTEMLLARIRNILRLRSYRQADRERQMRLVPVEIPVTSMDEQFLKEVDKCIEENLSECDFSVEILAEKLSIGRTTLYRKVLALTGEDPTHYIRSFRLNKAAQMLKESKRSIIEVALDAGFSSSSYFTRCFKEMFHRLPSGFSDSENG